MTARTSSTKFRMMCLTIFALSLAAMYHPPLRAQTPSERFWIAGRYDGTRIIVYFDAVEFMDADGSKDTVPQPVHKLRFPVAENFMYPIELPATYIAKFQKDPRIEHFHLGDQYDLILGNGQTAVVTLTSLIGCDNSPDGNESFIGALATTNNPDSLLFLHSLHYALRRHHPLPPSKTRFPSFPPESTARLIHEPIRFDIQTQIAALISQRVKETPSELYKGELAKGPPEFAVQSFRTAEGGLRYYAQAKWIVEEKPEGSSYGVIGAWISPTPSLHILAVEPTATSDYQEGSLPDLLNVVDLGGGKTGVIISISGLDGWSFVLFEYRDGASSHDMRVLNSISHGE
jgi:hypothetical protein